MYFHDRLPIFSQGMFKFFKLLIINIVLKYQLVRYFSENSIVEPTSLTNRCDWGKM